MEALYIIFALSFALPASIAAIGRGIPAQPPADEKVPYTKFGRYVAIFTAYWLVALALLAGYEAISDLPNFLVAILLAAICATTLCLTYAQFNNNRIFTEHKWIFSIVLTYMTLTISWLSTKYAEAMVSDELGISASEIPTTVYGVALLIAPLWWLLALSMSLLAPYAYSLLSLPFMEATRPEQSKSVKDNVAFVTVMHAAGLATTSIALFNFIPLALDLSWTKETFHSRIYETTFPLTKTPCQIKTNEGDRFRVVSDKEILIARVTKNAAETDDGLPVYSISREKCTRIKESAAL